VRLAAPPVDDLANQALCSFLAKVLGVPLRAVRVASGDRSRIKRVAIAGMAIADAHARLIPQPE
jgi:uncharacterized protein YggU (UPF0235/DUF167 family)